MDGENVLAFLQQADVRADVETLEDDREGVAVGGTGVGVEGERGPGVARGVLPGDLGAVEVGDKAVVVAHVERHRSELADPRGGEWRAHEDGLLRLWGGDDLEVETRIDEWVVGAGCAVLVTGAERACRPAGVVKSALHPARVDGVVGGHDGELGRVFGHEYGGGVAAAAAGGGQARIRTVGGVVDGAAVGAAHVERRIVRQFAAVWAEGWRVGARVPAAADELVEDDAGARGKVVAPSASADGAQQLVAHADPVEAGC